MIDLRSIARALGGEVSGDQTLAPGPGHGKRDRSLSIKLSADDSEGFVVHSHAGDDWTKCRDYVREGLRLPKDGWKKERSRTRTREAPQKHSDDDKAEREKARWFWRGGGRSPARSPRRICARPEATTASFRRRSASFLPATVMSPP